MQTYVEKQNAGFIITVSSLFFCDYWTPISVSCQSFWRLWGSSKKNEEKATKPTKALADDGSPGWRGQGCLLESCSIDWPPTPLPLSPKPYAIELPVFSDIPSSVWRTTKAVVQLVSWHVSAHGRCKHCHDELFNKEKAKLFGVVWEMSELYTVACYQNFSWFGSLVIIAVVGQNQIRFKMVST